MVAPEEACGDVVRHDHVYAVVIVSQEDAENAHATERPTHPVVAPKPPRRICNTTHVLFKKTTPPNPPPAHLTPHHLTISSLFYLNGGGATT